MRIAACQMVSGTNIDENIHTAKSLIDSAAQSGAELVVLPEYFSLMPASDKDWVTGGRSFRRWPRAKSDESGCQGSSNLACRRHYSS